MRQIFIDTSAWAALADSTDKNHHVAVDLLVRSARQSRLVTTNYVLDETFTLLLVNIGYGRTVELKRRLDAMEKQNDLRIVWVDAALAHEAWLVFERFNTDKRWSFTDCVSYAVMKQN